jgi:hypothetical protein
MGISILAWLSSRDPQIGEFDKKKFKREYLGRIIDNVDFFHEQSCIHLIFINSHVRILFFINSRFTIINW